MRRRRRGVLGLLFAGLALAIPAGLAAQTVALEVTAGTTFSSITPLFTVRTAGLGPDRPLLVNVQLSSTPDFTQVVFDSAFTKTDSVFAVQLTRPLQSEAQLYARARVRAFAGPLFSSPTVGPKTVPAWLRLIRPNSPTGDGFDIRRPELVWSGAPVLASVGPWRYDVEVTLGGRPEVAVSGLRDTTWRPVVDLQASASYGWNVRAYLPSGESSRRFSAGTFVITDPLLPTTNLLYQNFPNPFPSAESFATCFWFDVGEDGARISLDVLDLRGNLVKRIVPGNDGVELFPAGRYGRGAPGTSSNCDNRFVWDGTAADGRTVAPGVFLARFRANNGAPTVRRIVFRGR